MKRSKGRTAAGVAGLAAALTTTAVLAGQVFVPGFGNSAPVAVESFKERKFRNVVQQRYDFSCGSAAVATLLSYHYDSPHSEADVFQAMYDSGDKQKIKREGFSMLDMRGFLVERGYQADGYRLPLDKLAKIGVPTIVLLNTDGYSHFVVIKGIEPTTGQVLVGDSARGRKVFERDDFEQQWNGIAFLIRNHASISKQHFNLDEEWLVSYRFSLDRAQQLGNPADMLLHLPPPGDF